MGWETEIPDVVPEQPIESAWGNEVRDKIVHVVATPAALPSDADDGSLAYVESTDVLHIRRAGAWYVAATPTVLSYKETTTSVTIGGSVTITALTTTLTVPAGRMLRLTFHCYRATNNANANGSGIVAFSDGAELGAKHMFLGTATGSGGGTGVDLMSIYRPTAGAKTLNVVSAPDAGGSFSLSAQSGRPMWFLVEDLGAA